MSETPADEAEIREQIAHLRAEHRRLDEAVTAMESDGGLDQLAIKRAKKGKLQLKDRISALEDKLRPDIIA
ncbi:MAG: DUF465 domain-containing protein [Pseudomonadota bacterium]